MSQVKRTPKPVHRASARRQKQNRAALILLMIGIPIVIAGVVLAALYNRGQSTDVSVDDTRLVRADSQTLGAAEAPVTIVEFLDPECESCRAAFPFVKQLLQEYEGRIRLVVRYFPLHNNSRLAIAATEAAGEQGQYWEMQELLFTNQPQWGEQSAPQTDLFISYAEQLGLNTEAFATALQNPDYAEKAERDYQDGSALGVDGTPTFFINGRQVEELSADAIIGMIEEELAS